MSDEWPDDWPLAAVREIEQRDAELTLYQRAILSLTGGNERLRRLLHKHGSHAPGCPVPIYGSDRECSCGWHDLSKLGGLDDALSGTELATNKPAISDQPAAAPWGRCVWCDAPSDTKDRDCPAPDGDGHLFKRAADPTSPEHPA